MQVRVVPLPCLPDELKFDIILPEGYAKTCHMDIYEIRQYRGLGIAEIIEQKVLDFLSQLEYSIDCVSIVYC